jgi:hypothetical protein
MLGNNIYRKLQDNRGVIWTITNDKGEWHGVNMVRFYREPDNINAICYDTLEHLYGPLRPVT